MSALPLNVLKRVISVPLRKTGVIAVVQKLVSVAMARQTNELKEFIVHNTNRLDSISNQLNESVDRIEAKIDQLEKKSLTIDRQWELIQRLLAHLEPETPNSIANFSPIFSQTS